MKLSSIVFIVLIAIILLLFIGWSKAPDFIARHLSKQTHVTVSIDDIDVSLNSLRIQKTNIGSPKGSLLPKAFSSEEILLEAPLTHYLNQHIEIDEISLDHIYLGLEFDSKGSKEGNWTTIMRNMKQSSPTTMQPKDQTKTARTVMIKKLLLTDLSIDLVYRNEGNNVKHLAPIARLELTNVSSEGGIPADQISQLILAETLKSVFQQQGLENMLEDVFDMPQTTLEKFTQPFKSLFN